MRRNRTWLTWLLCGAAAALFALAVVLVFANGLSSHWDNLSQLAFAVFTVMGLLIALRRPEHLIGRLFLVEGLLAAITFAGQQYAVWLVNSLHSEKLGPDLLWRLIPEYVASGFLWIVFFVIILLFPDGRLPSPRWRPFARVASGVVLLASLFMLRPGPMTVDPVLPPVDNPLGVAALAALNPFWVPHRFIGFAVGLGCLLAPVLRYRWAGGIERQQIKWLAFGALILMLNLATFIVTAAVTLPAPVKAALDLIAAFSAGLIPVLIAVAILNYRLYDIDIIMRRTLIYGALTTLLAGVYLGGVVLLQALLRPLTGAGNDLAVVATTLLIAALFLPLRQGVQRFIDRRFYRRKYDAAKILAAFGEHARDEVELDKLTGRLVEVVDETMQPATISLWLRETIR